MTAKRAFAVAAHPDDIEFLMAGTLMLLKDAGYEIHYMNIANGSCGTARHAKDEIIRIRRDESIAAAELLGATFHESLVDDIEIYYQRDLLARVGAAMRDVAPEILLVQSPIDYMEDHQNAVRLAVSAAFNRGMPNFPTDPPREPVTQDVTVYHAQPHGNRDPLRQVVWPDFLVDIGGVIAKKRDMLACHQSQKLWLDESQGMDSYLNAMEQLSHETAGLTVGLEYAEGWRRRLHLGFCGEHADPLADVLAEHVHGAKEKRGQEPFSSCRIPPPGEQVDREENGS